MSRFSMAARTTVTSNATVIEIINTSTDKEAFVKEVAVSTNTAAAHVIGFGRPAAAGITPTSPVALLDEQGLATGLVKTAVAWGTGPTIPTVFARRFGGPATAGTRVVWPFAGKGFRLAPLGTATIWMISGTSNLYDVSVEVEQDVNTVVTP